MTVFEYKTIDETARRPVIGLIVLQSDQTIEPEFRKHFLPEQYDFFVSRIPSGLEVTKETLAQMAGDLTQSAKLFPRGMKFDCVGYGCTSGTSVIGVDKIATLTRQGCETSQVTEPVSGLIAACKRHGVRKLAFLSPYIESVSDRLRGVLADNGIETPVFGTFNEAEEAKVAQIDGESIYNAAISLGKTDEVDAIFLSCTNLKTIDIADKIRKETGKPVFSSNSVLADHMKELAEV